MSAEGPCAVCLEDSDDLTCPGCVEDAVAGAVESERARVLAIVDKAMMSPKLKPGTRMALAIVARRVRDPLDDADPAEGVTT